MISLDYRSDSVATGEFASPKEGDFVDKRLVTYGASSLTSRARACNVQTWLDVNQLATDVAIA